MTAGTRRATLLVSGAKARAVLAGYNAGDVLVAGVVTDGTRDAEGRVAYFHLDVADAKRLRAELDTAINRAKGVLAEQRSRLEER